MNLADLPILNQFFASKAALKAAVGDGFYPPLIGAPIEIYTQLTPNDGIDGTWILLYGPFDSSKNLLIGPDGAAHTVNSSAGPITISATPTYLPRGYGVTQLVCPDATNLSIVSAVFPAGKSLKISSSHVVLLVLESVSTADSPDYVGGKCPLDLSDLGDEAIFINIITSPDIFSIILGPTSNTAILLDFSGAGLSVASVDGLLAELASGIGTGGTLNISGAFNEAPTGGDTNADIVTLVSRGWTIIHN